MINHTTQNRVTDASQDSTVSTELQFKSVKMTIAKTDALNYDLDFFLLILQTKSSHNVVVGLYYAIVLKSPFIIIISPKQYKLVPVTLPH